MLTRQRKRSRLSGLILPGVTAAYLAYFGFWSFHGDYGIWAATQLQADAVRLQAELDALVKQHDDLKRHIALLGPDAVEADLLDEKARAELEMARPDEIVIFDSARSGARQ